MTEDFLEEKHRSGHEFSLAAMPTMSGFGALFEFDTHWSRGCAESISPHHDANWLVNPEHDRLPSYLSVIELHDAALQQNLVA